MTKKLFALPDLPYEKTALEPFISAKTLDFHHGKHHNAYITNLNKLIDGTSFIGLTLEEIMKASSKDSSKAGVFNNAAQTWNHTFYWNSIKPKGGGSPHGGLMTQINDDFGSFSNFVDEFKTAGATQFGSGWAWLVLENNKLKVVKTPNANCPLVDNQTPLFTMDVWEHAYYIDYQNRRPDYIAMFIDKLVNWDFALENFSNAQK